MRATDLAIQWIGAICCLALVLAIGALLVSREPEVIKASLVVAGVAGTGVGGLVGYIGGYHAARPDLTKPEPPEIT
jgi:membrane protein DedA with SNARE-associated domain